MRDSLHLCLEKFGLSKLPNKSVSPDVDFKYAIVYIESFTGKRDYCIARKTEEGKTAIIKTFGDCGAVKHIIDTYPIIDKDCPVPEAVPAKVEKPKEEVKEVKKETKKKKNGSKKVKGKNS